jgi:hypothetical protein
MHVFDSNILQYKYSVTVTVNYCTVFKKKSVIWRVFDQLQIMAQ